MNIRFRALLAVLFVFVFSLTVRATTYLWFGNNIGNPYYQYGDYNWNNPYNWYPTGVPGQGDTAVITNAGSIVYFNNTANVVSNLVVGAPGGCTNSSSVTLYMQGQTLYLYGQLYVDPCSYFLFDSGTVVGMNSNATLSGQVTMSINGQIAGTLNVGTNSTLFINSGADHNIPNSILNNYGTVAWSAGRIRGGGQPGTVVNNFGIWDSQGDLSMNADYAGNGFVFNNYGTLRKSAGSNTTTLGPLPFYSSGNVDVQTGTISLNAGGTLTGGIQTGSGFLTLTSGGFNLNGMTTTSNLFFTGGSLYGTTVINGSMTWVGGNMNGASSVTLTSNSVLNVTSASDHDLASTTFTNFGYVAWSGPGRMRGGGLPGTAIYNYGTWDSQGDWVLNNDYSGDGTVFNNFGLFRKSAGASTTLFNGVYLYNTGTLEIDSAAITLNAGGLLTGGAQTGPGTLAMTSGGFTLDGMTTTTNAQLNGGILYGDNVINSGLTWVSGDWINANSVTITSNSLLYIVSGSDHNLAYISVTNYGTVAWNGGRVRGGGIPEAYIYNFGLWDSQGDLTFNDDYGGDGTIFYNFGTFRKSVGTSTTTVSSIYFQNAGLVDIQTGSVAQSGGFLNSGTVNIASGTFSMGSGGVFTGGMQTGGGVLQLAGGSFSFNGLIATNLLMTGGELYGSNLFSGAFTWAGGDFNAATSVTIASNTIFNIVSSADHNFSSCTLNNYGTMTWSGGGRIRGGGIPGSAINNYGLWDTQGDLVFNDDYSGAGTTISNFGTFRKSVGTGTTTFSAGIFMNNLGTMDLETGSVATSGGFANTGTMNIVNGAISLSGGGALTGGAQTGAGLLQMAAGSFTVDGMTTTTNLQMTGGTLYGSNYFSSGLTWIAGNWDSANAVTIPTNTALYVVSGADHDLPSCTLNNFGSVVWTGGRLRGGGNPATVYNNYGSWDSQADLTFNSDFSLNGCVFNNRGTFLKSGGTGNTTFGFVAVGPAFRSSGVLNVASGSVVFNYGASFTGGSVIGSGNVYLSSGAFSINTTTTTTNVQEVGGYLSGSNVIAGGFTWSSGNWNSASSVTIAPKTELDIVSTADHDLANCKLINNGRVEWMGGRIRGGGNPGTIIVNNGVWEAQCDYTLNSDFSLNGIVFNNAGTFRKFNTTGTTTWNPSGGLGASFVNAGGSIELDSGTLSLPGTFSTPASGLTVALGGTNAGQWGRLTASMAIVGGPLNVILTNNFQPATPEQFVIVSGQSLSGGFSPANVPSGLSVSYTNASVILTAASPAPVHISLALSGTNVLGSFPTSPNQSYTVQLSTNLASGNWSNYLTIIGNGATEQFSLPITNSVPQLFLRVSEP